MNICQTDANHHLGKLSPDCFPILPLVQLDRKEISPKVSQELFGFARKRAYCPAEDHHLQQPRLSAQALNLTSVASRSTHLLTANCFFDKSPGYPSVILACQAYREPLLPLVDGRSIHKDAQGIDGLFKKIEFDLLLL